MATIKKTESPIESAVSELLRAAGFVSTVTHRGLTKREQGAGNPAWECDAWAFTIHSAPGLSHVKQAEFEYYTGLGHRKAPPVPSYMKHEHPSRVRAWTEQNAKPVAPHVAGLLHSVILDGSALDNNFMDWCADYGYSTDSISAVNTYNACCENARKLQNLIGRDTYAKLAEALQDY